MKFHELSDVLPIHEEIRYEILGTNIEGLIKVQGIDESDIANLDVLAISFSEGLVTLKPLTYKLLVSEQKDIDCIAEMNSEIKDVTREQLLQEMSNVIRHKFNEKVLTFTIIKNN